MIEKARCLLHKSSLNNKFWEEGIKTAVYMKNCSPSKAVWGKIPFEVWYNAKQESSDVRPLGIQ